MESRDRVFTSVNAPRHWMGADYRLAYIAGGFWMLCVWVMHGFWWPLLLSIGLWAVGAAMERRDPRFLEFLPLRFQLKSRYEAGRRK